MTWPVLEWRGLYRAAWKNEITPAAFSHPAKFARGLIQRIYAYLFEQGYLHADDMVLDPFGGVGLGGLDAMRLGCHWIGIELEPKFVGLGNANITLWNKRYAGRFATWGTARLVQGDSRRLLDVLGEAQAAGIVASPPYADAVTTGGDTHQPLFRSAEKRKTPGGRQGLSMISGDYGDTPGQLGALPAGNVDSVIGSPPFRQTTGGVNVTSTDGPLSDSSLITRHAAGNAAAQGYGDSEGNLANMKEGKLNAIVSSPPFLGVVQAQDPEYQIAGAGHGARHSNYGDHPAQLANLPEGVRPAAVVSSPPYENKIPSHDNFVAPHDSQKRMGVDYDTAYGLSSGQLGNDSGPTFWQAAAVIVAQCYAALRPGGVAAFVTKDYVRNKARVPFCDDWRRLCESVGFETVAEIRAWLVEDHGTQLETHGNGKRQRTERKSFFRRLAERKGAPAIDYETVWILRKAG